MTTCILPLSLPAPPVGLKLTSRDSASWNSRFSHVRASPSRHASRLSVHALAERDPLGEVGAREPRPGEVGSGFGERPLGNADTEHRILLPDNVREITGLAQYSCQAGELPLLKPDDAKALLRKLVGWKLAEEDGTLKLRAEWKMKNFMAGMELFGRIAAIAEKEKHHPDLHLEGWNKVTADIWSHSRGGVTMNDFILAAKIDLLDTRDLVSKKNRAWA